MTIYTDQGGGITDDSLELFESLKGKLGELIHMWLYRDDNFNVPTFSCEIEGMEGTVLLSGVNCGYGGTGPHGSQKILKMICEENKDIAMMHYDELQERSNDIFKYGKVYIQFPNGMKW